MRDILTIALAPEWDRICLRAIQSPVILMAECGGIVVASSRPPSRPLVVSHAAHWRAKKTIIERMHSLQ
jgi:hypothetical protein